MRELSSVDSFGGIDADNDDLVLDAFEDHEAFTNIQQRKRFLIVGRKGSGKTAIFKKLLTMHSPDRFMFGHTFSDYPWHHHDRQARVGIPDFDKYTHSWKYLTLLTASKVILSQDQSLPFDDNSMEGMARLERFVIDTYGSKDPDVTQVFTPSKELKLKPHFEIDWKLLKAGVSPERVPMDYLPTVIQEVNQNLQRCVLSCLHPEHEYFIGFDQLDLGFDPRKPEYSDRLIGLLLACRDLNMASRDAGKKLFVVVFLRDDIYDTLHFEDKNKLTENFLSRIEWDTRRTDRTLKQLMERRFSVVLSTKEDENIGWNQVFDEEKEMAGHQSKYDHILDRTLLRPRDIIKFTNSVLRQYKSRVEPGGSKQFENADINSAKQEYSEYFLSELDDEIHKHIPNYKDHLELLRAIGVWQFERSAFEAEAAKHPSSSEGATPAEILQQFYEFSIVGFYRPGGRGYGGSEYVFRYREPQTRFDNTATRFRIHPGLIEVLGLKKYTLSREEDGAGA